MDAQNSLLRRMLSVGLMQADGNVGMPVCSQPNSVALLPADQRLRSHLTSSAIGDRSRIIVVGQSRTPQQQRQHSPTLPTSEPLWNGVLPASGHFAPAGFTLASSGAVNATPSLPAIPVMSFAQSMRGSNSALLSHSCGPVASLSLSSNQQPLLSFVASGSRNTGPGSISAGRSGNNGGALSMATSLAPYADRASAAVREVSPSVCGPADDLLPSLGWIDVDMALDASVRPTAGDPMAGGYPFSSLDVADAADGASPVSGNGVSFMDLKVSGVQPPYGFGIQQDAVDGNLLDYAGDGSQFLRGTENILAAYPVHDDFIDLDFELPTSFSVADVMLPSGAVTSSPPTCVSEPTTVSVVVGCRVTSPQHASLESSGLPQTKNSAAAGGSGCGLGGTGLGTAVVCRELDAESSSASHVISTAGANANRDCLSTVSSGRMPFFAGSGHGSTVADGRPGSYHRRAGIVVPGTPTVHAFCDPSSTAVPLTKVSAVSGDPRLPTAASYYFAGQADRSPSPATNGLMPIGSSSSSSSPLDFSAREQAVASCSSAMSGSTQIPTAVERLAAPTANAVRQQRMLATEDILRRSGLLDATMLTGRVTARQRVIQFEIQKLKQAMQEFVMSVVCEEPETKRRRFH